MKGRLIKVAGTNLTFRVGQYHATIPVSKTKRDLIDLALRHMGAMFEVLTSNGEIIDMKRAEG